MLPPYINDLVQEDLSKILTYTATDAYHNIVDGIVQKLDNYFLQQATDLTIHPQTADAIKVDMEHILDKFFLRFCENLETIQGKDEFANIVAGDVLAGLINLGYDAQKAVRYDAGADNLYSSLIIKKT